MSPRHVRGTVLAVLLCSALAGCGSVVAGSVVAGSVAASAPAAGQGSSSAAAAAGATSSAASAAGTATAVADAAGCADVTRATSVAVHRVLHLVEPTREGALSKTQRDATLVRALYSQFCAAITHPATIKGTVRCPANLGVSYAGTFYDGRQALATFVYGATGCQTASLTADGQTKITMMAGSASAAAPKLQADLAQVLGVRSLAIAQPKSGTGIPRDGSPVTG